MPFGLAALPQELLLLVVNYLQFEDYVYLKFTSKHLNVSLDGESIGKDIVEVRGQSVSHRIYHDCTEFSIDRCFGGIAPSSPLYIPAYLHHSSKH